MYAHFSRKLLKPKKYIFNVTIVKICEESETLPYLQTNMLACQFHGCWQKIRNTWVRDKGQLITHSDISSQILVIILTGWWEEGQVTLTHMVVALQEGNLEHSELKSLKMDSKHVCCLLWMETLYIP